MLLLDQHFDDKGGLESTYLDVATTDGEAIIVLRVMKQPRGGEAEGAPHEIETREVPEEILSAIFRRYGKPLADDIAAKLGEERARLALPWGGEIVALRHLARFDVIAKDWLVWVRPPLDPRDGAAMEPRGAAEPVAELATAVTAALRHVLARLD